MSSKIQTGCIQTILDTRGKVTGYKMIMPVSREHARDAFQRFCCNKAILFEWKKKYYITLEDNDFDALWAYKCKLQMIVADIKIEWLTIKRDGAMAEYSYYLSQLHKQ